MLLIQDGYRYGFLIIDLGTIDIIRDVVHISLYINSNMVVSCGLHLVLYNLHFFETINFDI